jgi:hypothetical protein
MSYTSATHVEARFNAYHEAGHAVAALVQGFRVKAIDIRPVAIPGLGLTLGATELDIHPIQHYIGKGEDAVMPLLIVFLSGVFAEQRVNPQAGLDVGHPDSDGQRAMQYAAAALCIGVLRNGKLMTPGEEVQKQMKAIIACVEKAMNLAEAFATSHGAAIDAVGDSLACSGVLAPDTVASLVAAAMTS